MVARLIVDQEDKVRYLGLGPFIGFIMIYKYWVVVNDTYYPSFGLADVEAAFKTLAEAKNYVDTNCSDDRRYVQIVDVEKFVDGLHKPDCYEVEKED